MPRPADEREDPETFRTTLLPRVLVEAPSGVLVNGMCACFDYMSSTSLEGFSCPRPRRKRVNEKVSDTTLGAWRGSEESN